MSVNIPETHLDLTERPIYAVFTTISPQGYPENTIVWFSWDGEHVLVNTVEGRRKINNVHTNPRVALTVLDPENPFRWMDVRGEVVEIVKDENYAHIDALAHRYTGKDRYYGGLAAAELEGKENRLILKIAPRRVLVYPQ